LLPLNSQNNLDLLRDDLRLIYKRTLITILQASIRFEFFSTSNWVYCLLKSILFVLIFLKYLLGRHGGVWHVGCPYNGILKSRPFMPFFLPLYIVNTSTHSVSSLNLLVFGFHPNQQQSSSASSFFSLFFFLFVFETLTSPMACLEVCKEVTINIHI